MEAADGHHDPLFFLKNDSCASLQIRSPLEISRPVLNRRMEDSSDSPIPEPIRPADELLPELYSELRRLAVALTGKLLPGQTLQPTALVHEAYLRLVKNRDPGWEGRRHFFGAAAQAMREILIEQARRKGSRKRGGGAHRVELSEGLALIEPPAEDLLALDEAIEQLRAHKPHLAEVVLLRYFTGMSVEETADVTGRSISSVTRDWRFARAWLAGRLGDQGPPGAQEPGDD
jgi:RNA polymerase sigma factor (TIGR02999 family)